jgi:diguanylate cyclase (GGDEF)-like protein
LLTHIWNRLTSAPKVIDKKELPEYFAILLTSLAVIVMHVILLFVFLSQNVMTLAYFNIVSVLAWILTIALNERGKASIAVFVALVEIMAHAILAVSVLGLDYGFQMYLWPVACMVAVAPKIKLRSAFVFSLICLATFVTLYGVFPNRTSVEFLPEHIYLIFSLVTLSGGIPLIIWVSSLRTIYTEQHQKLEKMANFDMLTSLHNRRYFQAFLNAQREHAKSEASTFCIALGDIDKFKDINDRYGHDAGDHVLVGVSNLLSRLLSRSDGLCRWGGEEFIIFIPNSTLKDATPVIEAVRDVISTEVFVKDSDINVTMSFGIVEVDGNEKIDTFIKRADELLYKAKNAGRNNVQV